MSWREWLAVKRGDVAQKCADALLPKPTNGFVGFVGAPDGPAAITEAIRARLLRLADEEGVPAEVVHRLLADDVVACQEHTDQTLRTYLRVLERERLMDAGIVPGEYTRAVHCAGCGWVWLWRESPSHLQGCPWCYRRKAGRAFPQPPSSGMLMPPSGYSAAA